MNRLLLLFFLAAPSAWTQDQAARDASVRYVQEKLRTIIIPEIDLDETPFPDAIEFLVAKSRELDPDPDLTRRGIGVIIRGPIGRPETRPRLGFDDPDASGRADAELPKVTLHRKHISLGEAFRTLAELGGFRFSIERHAVVFQHLPPAPSKQPE